MGGNPWGGILTQARAEHRGYLQELRKLAKQLDVDSHAMWTGECQVETTEASSILRAASILSASPRL